MRFDDSPDGSAVYAHPLIQLADRAVPRRTPFERGLVLRGSDERPIIALNADDLSLDVGAVTVNPPPAPSRIKTTS